MFRPDKGRPLRIGKRPALVHNTETLAHVALIARHGPAPFRAQGMADEPGTCLITISGGVKQPGVVEADQGTPLWEIAVRAAPGEPVQALLIGGYGGTWVAPEHFLTPYASVPLGLSEQQQVSGRSLCSVNRHVAWRKQRGLPAILPTRAQVSVDRVFSGFLPSQTT